MWGHLLMCVQMHMCPCMYACTMLHMWRSEDNLRVSLFSSTQVLVLVASTFSRRASDEFGKFVVFLSYSLIWWQSRYRKNSCTWLSGLKYSYRWTTSLLNARNSSSPRRGAPHCMHGTFFRGSHQLPPSFSFVPGKHWYTLMPPWLFFFWVSQQVVA